MKTQTVVALAALAQDALAAPRSQLQPRQLAVKAGLSGYIGIQNTPAFKSLAPYISWYTDYTPNPPQVGNIQAFGMLWGASGSPCNGVSDVLSTFTKLTSAYTPPVMFGFYEPDCYCPDSSQMTIAQAQAAWNSLIAPLGFKGTTLGSPSMCKQLDEDFLTPFASNITRYWDVTSIHVNVPTLDLVKADVEYYRKYNRPIFVSEFACVDGRNGGWAPCTNQTQINTFIQQTVQYLESQPDVIGYGASNGNGLGDVWPLTTAGGALTATGTAYMNAIKAAQGKS